VSKVGQDLIGFQYSRAIDRRSCKRARTLPIGRGNRGNRGTQVPPTLAGSDRIRVKWHPWPAARPVLRADLSRLPRALHFVLRSISRRGDPLDVVFDVTASGRAWSARTWSCPSL